MIETGDFHKKALRRREKKKSTAVEFSSGKRGGGVRVNLKSFPGSLLKQ